jgi:hypothetical protein
MPNHPKESPKPCLRSNQLPLDKGVSFAEAYLAKIKNHRTDIIESRKITLTVTKNLKKNYRKIP